MSKTWCNLPLRSYYSESRAKVYAATLAKRFPGAAFEVRQSPYSSYAFRYLILCTRGAHSPGLDSWVIGDSWVGK